MTPNALLLVVAVPIGVNLAGLFLLWRHIDRCVVDDRALAQRVSHLEATVADMPRAHHLSQIREHIAAIRERHTVTASALQTIQVHLLERERNEAIRRKDS